jgi:hypothetical protein
LVQDAAFSSLSACSARPVVVTSTLSPQAAYGIPWMSGTKANSGWHPLRQYVTGAKIHGRAVMLFHHLPVMEHGANLVIEVMHEIITREFLTDKGSPLGELPDTLYVQFDNW